MISNVIYGLENFSHRKENYRVIDHDVVEHCDVCIIGSGAAGAILAKKLCETGRSVVLLEKGGYFEGEDMNQRDEDMMPLLWMNSGINFSDDLRIAIAQGSCLGGSTVINDAVCFEIPDIVKKQWRELGVNISDLEWQEAADEIKKEIHVTQVQENELNRNSSLLKRGCELLGFTKHSRNFRNCVNCMQCGLCHLGCHYETKQDMRVTYIHNALNNPKSNITIYCNCSAEKIDSSGPVINAVEGEFRDRDGNLLYTITVNTRIVVVSAGSIASSGLLLRNLIAEDRAGRGLALHPAPFLLGDFDSPVRGNQGIPMSYTLHEFGVTNGVEKGGFLIESIYLPPLQFSMPLSISGGQVQALMQRYDHYAMAGVLVRDRSNGTITVTDQGFTRVSYKLGQSEVDAIAKGIEILAKMWFKLGATKVVSCHIDRIIINGENEIHLLTDAIRNNPQGLLLGSAHPQGGNSMGEDPKTCVVDSNCLVHGFKNLFVCDASVFPTALGVNPQLTVMSLATILANRINKRWNTDFAQIPVSDRLGQVCSIKQPMYCSTSRLDDMYETRDNLLPPAALVNSSEEEIVDEENWSFDAARLTIRNNRYWKGFYSRDNELLNLVEIYAGGFWKRFWKEADGTIKGITHPYNFPDVNAHSEVSEEEYPGLGKVLRLMYTDPLYQPFTDLLKIVHEDTILGKAFTGRPPPRGDHLLTFSMSKKYTIDFMTQDDFRAIFEKKARKPEGNEVLGVWEGRLISDSALSPPLFRFRYYKEQGVLKCRYIFAGLLQGVSKVKLTQKELDMFDFTGGLLGDHIRMVRKDIMVGKYSSVHESIFRMFQESQGFLMRDKDTLCLPYLIRRVG